MHAGTQQQAKHAGSLPAEQVRRSWTHVRSACRNADQWLKHSLTENLDSLVALTLIVTLLVGSLVLTGFLAVQIGQLTNPLQTIAVFSWVVCCAGVGLHRVWFCGVTELSQCHDPAESLQLSEDTFSHHHQTTCLFTF